MSPNNRSTDNLLRRYLSGALTAPEEAELERRALTDEPLAEAMRGLQAHPEAGHQAHVKRMLQGARSQVQKEAGGAKIRPLRRNYVRFAAVASVLLLLVASALWILPQWVGTDEGDLAMQTRKEVPVAPEGEQAVQEVREPEFATEETAATPEPEAVSPAPSSPAPNLRARQNTAPPAQARTETAARERARLEAIREESARQEAKKENRSAPTRKMKRADDADVAGEVAISKETPAPVPAIEAAPPAKPLPSVANDELADYLRVESTQSGTSQGNVSRWGQSIAGQITNENGVPVANALVRLPGLPLGERTDSSGYFRVPADATVSRLEISHPDYEDESVDLNGRPESLQISLDRKEWEREERTGFIQDAARAVIILDKKPGYAAPLEGYANLRKRIEDNRPADVPQGKVKFSFTVNTDGTLTDFEFRGRPGRATMDYIGETLVKTSVWEITQGEEPVRVYLKVVF